MLRLRLSLLLATMLMLTMVAFGLLADWLFIRSQTEALRDLLQRDLERIQQLYASADLGQSVPLEERGVFTMQFVSHDGTVVIPRRTQTVLPLLPEASLTRIDGELLMIGSTPWRLPSGAALGTIRLALDASRLVTERRTLNRSLILSGSLLLIIAIFLSLLLLQRSLRPLASLAKQAAGVDPAHPQVMNYDGPDDEVAGLAKALNRSLEGIRQRQQAERDALAEVAHEIAAPLSVVAGHLQALALEQAHNERLQAANDAANELLYTSQDLLMLSRGELELPIEIHAFDLKEVVIRVVKGYPQVSFRCQGETMMLGSPERMTQVVRNLVRNAIQASTREQMVRVGLFETHDCLCMEVQDEGHGFHQDESQQIFERYHSSKQDGVGVGLAIAKTIIEQHQGTISVTSEPAKGSRFLCCFPRLADQLEDS